MPPAHDLIDQIEPVTADGEPAPGTYRGRRRRHPDVEVTERVAVADLVAGSGRQVLEPPAMVAPAFELPLPRQLDVGGPVESPVQHRTRAEARAALRGAQARRPVDDNVRRAPRRRDAATTPAARPRRRGLALAAAVGAVAALGTVTAVAGALPSRAGDQATAAFGQRAAAGVAVVDTGPGTVTSQQASSSLLADDTDRAFRMVGVSRSQERGPIAGCSGKVAGEQFSNGQIPSSIMCDLPFAPGQRLRADAAVRLIRLNEAYKGRFGENLCLTDSYRSISSQYGLAARKPGLAARPGTSEHGWGLAVDTCRGPDQLGSQRRAWFLQNAPAFGWVNPPWAQPGGSKPEPWHWEFAG